MGRWFALLMCLACLGCRPAPAQPAPAKTAPGETAPGKTAPGKTAPGKTAPGKTVAKTRSDETPPTRTKTETEQERLDRQIGEALRAEQGLPR